jgi:uncharacterized protein YdhG (YjbR/CyaY superfamily)
MKKDIPSDVSAYIAAASPKARPMLRELRRIIRACAPGATERLSYKMPYYDYKGRLVYFAAFSNHVSLFAWGRPMQLLAKEVKAYKTSTSTLQFPLGTRIPVALVKRLVKARVKDNEARKKTSRK